MIHPLVGVKCARDSERASAAQAAARSVSFETASGGYMAAHRENWRSHKNASEWATTLVQYAYPVFGRLPVQAIDTPLVLKVLKPIWETKRQTAGRLRGRIEIHLGLCDGGQVSPGGRQPRALDW